MNENLIGELRSCADVSSKPKPSVPRHQVYAMEDTYSDTESIASAETIAELVAIRQAGPNVKCWNCEELEHQQQQGCIRNSCFLERSPKLGSGALEPSFGAGATRRLPAERQLSPAHCQGIFVAKEPQHCFLEGSKDSQQSVSACARFFFFVFFASWIRLALPAATGVFATTTTTT
ncbi:hypothetical protein ACLKA6_017652 [Drosophila palustris]